MIALIRQIAHDLGWGGWLCRSTSVYVESQPPDAEDQSPVHQLDTSRRQPPSPATLLTVTPIPAASAPRDGPFTARESNQSSRGGTDAGQNGGGRFWVTRPWPPAAAAKFSSAPPGASRRADECLVDHW
jgi:hypothetical protein